MVIATVIEEYVVTKRNIEVPQRTHIELAVLANVHIDTEEETGIDIHRELLIEIPIDEALHHHIRTIRLDIALFEVIFGAVDIVACVVELLATLLRFGIFQHKIKLCKVAREEDVAIGLLGAVVDFEHITVGHTILIDLDLLAEVVVAHMLAIEHQLNRLTALFPTEGGVLLRHKEGQIGTHHRLIIPTCQQHPTLVFGHTEHFGLLAELDGVWLLIVIPRGVATTLNLGISLVKYGVTIAIINHHLGGNPRIFILDCLILLGVDHHNGQTRQSLIANLKFDGYGRRSTIRGNAIHNGLREIDSRLATDLRLCLRHHSTTIGNGEGRDQSRAIDIIGYLTTENSVCTNREIQISL